MMVGDTACAGGDLKKGMEGVGTVGFFGVFSPDRFKLHKDSHIHAT